MFAPTPVQRTVNTAAPHPWSLEHMLSALLRTYDTCLWCLSPILVGLWHCQECLYVMRYGDVPQRLVPQVVHCLHITQHTRRAAACLPAHARGQTKPVLVRFVKCMTFHTNKRQVPGQGYVLVTVCSSVTRVAPTSMIPHGVGTYCTARHAFA